MTYDQTEFEMLQYLLKKYFSACGHLRTEDNKKYVRRDGRLQGYVCLACARENSRVSSISYRAANKK